MNIGILVPATAETKNITEIAQRVEALGFESLWIPEHPVIPVGFQSQVPGGGQLPVHYRRWADPFVALTVAAAATTRLKLATGICLLPERNALLTAKVIAVDHFDPAELKPHYTSLGHNSREARDIAAALAPLGTRFEAAQENEPSSFLPASAESLAALELAPFAPAPSCWRPASSITIPTCRASRTRCARRWAWRRSSCTATRGAQPWRSSICAKGAARASRS